MEQTKKISIGHNTYLINGRYQKIKPDREIEPPFHAN